MSGKRTLYEIYLQDALSFERKYTEDYIEEIKTAFGPISLEEKAEFLRLIRQKHLSRIFALTALAATKPTPEEFEKLAPKTIMHLGDVINFIEIYHKIHKEEPNQYVPTLKKLIKEMPRTKTELYSYYSALSEVEEYLEKHLGVTLANQIPINDEPLVLENLDIPPMTFALHFLAVAKKWRQGNLIWTKQPPFLEDYHGDSIIYSKRY
ncbi:hypothetical protein [Thermococcus sp.]|uniref:hypothetical protein n=1 Tax=Thermococcus sp. TaxID=35749 RepID=UPI00199F48A5|nr:hypothetical protein [Thermococcus sp.]MBC7094477.1 hypothetical protein [Thermococcus sp.]